MSTWPSYTKSPAKVDQMRHKVGEVKGNFIYPSTPTISHGEPLHGLFEFGLPRLPTQSEHGLVALRQTAENKLHQPKK